MENAQEHVTPSSLKLKEAAESLRNARHLGFAVWQLFDRSGEKILEGLVWKMLESMDNAQRLLTNAKD